MFLVIHWALSAAALIVVTFLVPGVRVAGLGSAFLAALVIGLINATLGNVLKLITWPLRILTLGLLSLVINALMLMLAAAMVPGFRVDGFLSAFLGSILLSLVSGLFGWLVTDSGAPKRR